MMCLPSICKPMVERLDLDFFFRGQHCRCGVSLLLFIQNVPEVPMDADVEFEFGGVYRFGQVLCVI